MYDKNKMLFFLKENCQKCSSVHLECFFDSPSRKHYSRGCQNFDRYPKVMVKSYLFRESFLLTGEPSGDLEPLSDNPTKKL